MEDFPNAFLPTNERHDYFADVYPVVIGEQGEISMLFKDGTHNVWRGKSWNDVRQIIYKGQTIFLENYRSVLAQKEEHLREHGGTLSNKHLHDFRRAGLKPEI